jgi:penicillin-binding protein 2
MKSKRWINLLLLVILLVGCGRDVTPTALGDPTVYVTRTPSVEAAVRGYLDAYLVEDYESVFALISSASQAAYPAEDFAKRHTDALVAMTVESTEYAILSSLTNPQTSKAAFRLIYHTVLFGDLQRDFNLDLVLENGEWRLVWDTGLILPEMAGGRTLVNNNVPPSRGDIYDRNGNAIVTRQDAYALGLIAGEVNPENEDSLFYQLWRLTGVRPEVIRTDYQNYPAGLYVPVGEATVEAVERSGILGFSGVLSTQYSSRFYEPNVAAHAAGYTRFIAVEDDVNAYKRQGYSGGERIGAIGIEKWGEDYLRGRNAATLYVAGLDGSSETVIAQASSQPASSIYMTIDRDLQDKAQDAMDGLPGAIVVMEVDTGRILAMVSSPGFDPNLFDGANNNSMNVNSIFNNPEQPLFNRASQGTYPLGSVFKIISMAAALESGLFTADSEYECDYLWSEISGVTLRDWTYERCEQEKIDNGTDTCSTRPSGLLTLPEGLMRSCDPWFYHIGYTLYNQDQANAISDMARGFGLGRATGIGHVAEATGLIPNPTDGLNATSISIGQGDVLVTPLQVATYIAAIANGGTLYRPQLVEKIQPVSGDPVSVFRPESTGTLPVSPENLAIIQQAMISVVENSRGTAYARLGNFSIPVAAKTGTAESGAADPHAWFAGYSMLNNPDKPDIAVVVLVNYLGEGSEWAAPIFRRVMEIYFFGNPQTVYLWEETFGIIRQTETTTP